MLEVYDYYGYRNEYIFLDLCSLEHYFRCGLTISRVCDGSSVWESSLGENKDLVWRKPWIITFILLTSGKGFICSLDVEARQHVYIIEEFSLGFYHLATQWDFGWRMSWLPFIGTKADYFKFEALLWSPEEGCCLARSVDYELFLKKPLRNSRLLFLVRIWLEQLLAVKLISTILLLKLY